MKIIASRRQGPKIKKPVKFEFESLEEAMKVLNRLEESSKGPWERKQLEGACNVFENYAFPEEPEKEGRRYSLKIDVKII